METTPRFSPVSVISRTLGDVISSLVRGPFFEGGAASGLRAILFLQICCSYVLNISSKTRYSRNMEASTRFFKHCYVAGAKDLRPRGLLVAVF